MPKSQGLFSAFFHLDNISAAKVAVWLGGNQDLNFLENRLGNRLLYPSIIPQTEEDLNLDLAILREALKHEPQQYYNQTSKKISIPENLLTALPDLEKLAPVFIDVFGTFGLTTILLKSADIGTKNLGTLIKPEILSEEGLIDLWIHEKKHQIKIGNLVRLPAPESRVDIKFNSTAASLMGQEALAAEVAGGELGLIVDTRKLAEVK